MTSDNNSICESDWLRVMLSGQIWVSQITSKCTRWHQLNPHWGAQVLKDESVSMQMALDSILTRSNVAQRPGSPSIHLGTTVASRFSGGETLYC